MLIKLLHNHFDLINVTENDKNNFKSFFLKRDSDILTTYLLCNSLGPRVLNINLILLASSDITILESGKKKDKSHNHLLFIQKPLLQEEVLLPLFANYKCIIDMRR